MPNELKKLIDKVNRLENDKINRVLADLTMAWALEIAAELGTRGAVFDLVSAFGLVLSGSIQKLIDENGGRPPL
ncbi:hypothetical protein PTKIN_Ptkin07bG0065300 [Pterospermum kingtungense]